MWAVSWIGGELVECHWSPETQRRLIRLSLFDLRQKYEPTGWKLASVAEAYDELIVGNLFVFVGQNVMCLSESKPWFSAERILTEEFVDEGIPLDTVVAIMKKAAAIVDVNRFTVGTRAAANQRHAGLARHYQRTGLAVSTVELMGVINEQENPEDRSQV